MTDNEHEIPESPEVQGAKEKAKELQNQVREIHIHLENLLVSDDATHDTLGIGDTSYTRTVRDVEEGATLIRLTPHDPSEKTMTSLRLTDTDDQGKEIRTLYTVAETEDRVLELTGPEGKNNPDVIEALSAYLGLNRERQKDDTADATLLDNILARTPTEATSSSDHSGTDSQADVLGDRAHTFRQRYTRM